MFRATLACFGARLSPSPAVRNPKVELILARNAVNIHKLLGRRLKGKELLQRLEKRF